MIHNQQCAFCAEQLYRNPSQIKASKTGLFYCSRFCKNNYQTVQATKHATKHATEDCLGTIKACDSNSKLLFLQLTQGLESLHVGMDIHCRDERCTIQGIYRHNFSVLVEPYPINAKPGMSIISIRKQMRK